MEVIETFYDQPWERVILDRDEWADSEWEMILKIFNSKEADRIIIREYSIELHEGKEKS